MKIHTAVIRAGNASKERHAVLRRAITCSHDLTASARGWCPVHRLNTSRRIFAAVVCDIETNNRRSAPWRGTFRDNNLGDLAVLSEVLIRAQRGYELVVRGHSKLWRCA